MKQSGIIIFGSSRSEGNTYQIGKAIAHKTDLELIDLNELKISPYDYQHKNQDDDFMKLAEKMVAKRVIILLSPVYWYTMSAQMKIFIDRWSDLVTIRKDLGRKLKGVKLMTVSCGSDGVIGEEFVLPFSLSAKYLEMEFVGNFHTWKEDGTALDAEMIDVIGGIADQVNTITNKF